MPKSSEIEIKEIQVRLKEIYPNDKRTFDYVYGYASRNASFMCKKVWQGRSEKSDFFRTTSWLIALANKFEVDIGKSLIRRYPGICPYCLTAPCRCAKTGKKPISRTPAHKIGEVLEENARSYENTRTISFALCSELLENVYPNNRTTWIDAGPWKHCLKILEEIGEVHEAASGVLKNNKPIESLSEELADSMAWTLGAWSIAHEGSDLGEDILVYFKNNCPVCSKAPCSCGERGERPQEFPSAAIIRDLREKVAELSKILELDTDAESELLDSLKAAEDQQTESIVKRAFSQADEIADTALTGLGKTEGVAKKAAGIAGAIKSIVDAWPF